MYTVFLAPSVTALSSDWQGSDLTTPTPVFLLLFCCHLYQTLPSLSPSPSPSPSLPPPPSRTIVCEGILHSKIRQKVCKYIYYVYRIYLYIIVKVKMLDARES